ncbi:MAG TPA: C-GCAxxG-C-C family (seleno)protein [Desulfobacteria bacterium]|nr:C-GCAxxG-C-C family (seleno)protein [Desulfobacteria bacterium]
MQGNMPENKVPVKLAERAEELFNSGFNCCESIIKASVEVFELPLPDNVHLMGKFYGKGVAGTGCICGALAGAVMMLGFISDEKQLHTKTAEQFKAEFVSKFGSSCCRVIRKGQPLTGRWGNKECRELTRHTAELIVQVLSKKKVSSD